MSRRVSSLICALLVAAAAASCETIAGIEDHVYQPTSAQCTQYCDVVMRACTGKDMVYAGLDTCLGVCDRLPMGDALEPSDDNTVACRKRQADLAESTGEPAAHCSKAGPGGGGTCGTNCAGYCTLVKAACPVESAELTNCEQQCGPLRDTLGFDVVANHSGDTIQCRLVHTSTATVSPQEHCPHSQLHPTAPWCQDDQMAAPDCQNFCRFTRAVCTGDLAAYESMAQCLTFCSNFPLGTNADRAQNTVGCRQWHVYNSLLDSEAHCSHTGPGGDGHCGVDQPDKTGNCESYCLLLEKACAADFAVSYPNQAACQKACSNMPPEFGATHDSKYRVATAQTGNTLACRTLHVTRALLDVTECPSALGQGSCQ